MLPLLPGPSKGRRIIVTDDNPTRLYAITQTLRDAGHCVYAAYDGESALELVVMLPNIHLPITNTRLGLVDGPELMRRTRQLRPDLPILHVSHDGWAEPVPTPARVPTMTEPFSPNELLHAVRHLLPKATVGAMDNPRECRLRPEFGTLYPGVPAGEWRPAAELLDSVIAARLRAGRRSGELLRGRLLDQRHFEFRGRGNRSPSAPTGSRG